jgi:hypothetical protein
LKSVNKNLFYSDEDKMKNPSFSLIPCGKLILVLAVLSLAAVSALCQTQTNCIETTNSFKVVYPPNTDGGMDVLNSQNNIVLADDFSCTTPGPISDIHIWGSWLSNAHGTITNFWLAIYSDVPAVTNFSSGIITNSHPGILLWQQSFGPGQFAETIYGVGSETFYDPSVRAVIGTDTQVYYYCFYPTNAFKQQGTANAPTNYWLVAYAQVAGGGPTAPSYGWKTTLTPYNDGAVWGHYVVTSGQPIGDWQTMTNSQTGLPINLAFALSTPSNTPPVCVENGVKYHQDPNLFGGLDVWNNGPWVLADDFVCNYTGPISDIHIWGSWLTNNVATNTLTFWLAIYDNVAVSPTNNFSRPGNLLWKEQFVPGQYIESLYASSQETFLDPGPPNPLGPDTQAWYYCFYPTNQFTQTNGNTYWLMVYAQSQAGNTQMFGWKTSSNVLNDVSVHAPWPGSPPPNNPGWQPTLQASTGGALDLAFKITTVPRPPIVCVESDYDKYVQGPNIFGGDDVLNNPYVLADDFICTNTGPVSDIHLWGSWLNDLAMTNTIIFWLGIYDDVPAGSGNSFSHPGTNLLWQQTFSPGQYAETIWTNNAQELFLDPGTSNFLSSDSVVWYYCFYPTNAFEQTGTATNAKTYWLAAYAQFPPGAGKYGWKTTTAVLRDTSVHAIWPGSPPIANPGWTPTGYQPAAGGPPVPLDLAFKMTMCGPVTIHTNTAPWSVVVTWPGGGILQSATNVLGPYVDVPGFPPSPYLDFTAPSTTYPTNKFYRLRCY